jgi:hypothetical protein
LLRFNFQIKSKLKLEHGNSDLIKIELLGFRCILLLSNSLFY